MPSVLDWVRRVAPVATFLAVTAVLAGAFPRNVASALCAQVMPGVARTAPIAAPRRERGKCDIAVPLVFVVRTEAARVQRSVVNYQRAFSARIVFLCAPGISIVQGNCCRTCTRSACGIVGHTVV